MALLRVENAGMNFGGLRALSDISFEINENDLVGLIGPNGSGKTTTFNILSGIYAPSDGKIFFRDEEINAKVANQINKIGIARTFQNIRLFQNLTVIENVKIALHNSMSYSIFSSIFRLNSLWKDEYKAEDEALKLLDIFDLRKEAYTKATNLPYGKQRKLEIARALATKPSLLLLDEPAAGMNPSETKELMDTIALIRKRFSVGIILIEHDMNLVMGICDKLIVLDYGSIIAMGTPKEIKSNEKVITAYLGG